MKLVRGLAFFFTEAVSLIRRILRQAPTSTWKEREYFDRAWAQRIRQMALYIPEGSHILDLGCGQEWLKPFVDPNRYVGVDYRKRSPTTVIADFNKYQFPNMCSDVCFVSGCLEYIYDVRWFIKKVSETCDTCILSYCLLDNHKDIEMRRSVGWVNDIKEAEMLYLFGAAGFQLALRDETTTRNAIFVLCKSENLLDLLELYSKLPKASGKFCTGRYQGPKPALRYDYISKISLQVTGFTSERKLRELARFVDCLPSNSKIVELGVWFGRSAICLGLASLGSKKKVFAVDSWKDYETGSGLLSSRYDEFGIEGIEQVYQSFLCSLRAFCLTGSLTPIRKESLKASTDPRLQDIHLLFIDADHAYEAVLGDLKAWVPRACDDAIICGDDWDWPGVRSAVSDYAENNHRNIEVKANIWLLTG